ncbi:SusC/RagA family TonB-linked outer membrane protein [Hymenobacter algoricola]
MVTLLQQVTAQNRNISGRVTDRQSGEGLPGVTVLLKGTTNGNSTNSDGSYTLSNVPETGGTLVFSSIGYLTTERAIGTESQINIGLGTDSKQLSEVVVTALGIERDVRSLGYATQEVKAEQLSQKGTPNVLDALQGKVAGVNITGASGLAGASTNINIRGITSLQGSNQPLFVVDGIPISNDLDRTNGGPLGSLGGAQTSNRALDIDPENIESINILKGPAAAALYGSRASSGAIIITTKGNRGAANKKTEITVTSGLNFQKAYGLPDFQNEYGQGINGQIITTGGNGNIYTGSVNSWGPRFGTTPTLANGLLLTPDNPTGNAALPYQPYKDNINDFYRTGRLLTNGVNIVGGTPEQNVSLNVNNSDQKGITASSSLKRTSAQLSGNIRLLNKLRIGGSVNFIQTNTFGPLVGNGSSAFGQLINIPRSYDLTNLPYKTATEANIFFPGSDNPRWNLEYNPTTSNLTRFINVANLGYDITPWLSVAYRLGYDTYTDRRKQVFAPGANRLPTGLVLDETFFRSELNGDLLVTLKKDDILTQGLNANLLVGQNVNQRRLQNISSQADNLAFFGFTNSVNGAVFSNGTGEESNVRRLMGYYSSLNLSYKDYLFLELTGRADQSSTLPKDNNTFFYPAASFGFVFTDAFDITNDYLSYGKIRGNAAQVGRDALPYQLLTPYDRVTLGNNVASLNFPLNNVGGFGIDDQLGNPTLKPEFTKSYEGGVNLGFFKNRLTFDLTYFKTISDNQILPVAVPASTGYQTRVTNVGRVDNKGFEGLVNVTPIRTDNFRWDVSANYTHLRNEVISIAPGVREAPINGNAFTGTIPSFVVGQPYGVIRGNKKPRTADGKYIIDPATGLWAVEDPNQVIADPNPDWQGGLTNTLSYRGINLSMLVDARVGGDLVSFTNGFYRSRGALEETGVDREAPRVIPGVIITSRNTDGSIATTRPNNVQVDAQSYWQNFGLQSDLNVYDATVYRLREVSLGYNLPKAVLSNLPFGAISLQFVARNLFYYAPNANFDPELNTQGAGNIRGLDIQGPPNTRTYGVNLRFSL